MPLLVLHRPVGLCAMAPPLVVLTVSRVPMEPEAGARETVFLGFWWRPLRESAPPWLTLLLNY